MNLAEVYPYNETFEKTMTTRQAQHIPGMQELLDFEMQHGGLGNVAVVTFERSEQGECPVAVYTYVA